MACHYACCQTWCLLALICVQTGLAVYGSSKGVLPTKVNSYLDIKVLVTALPPLIIEVCRSDPGRLVAEVTFNLQILSDLDGLRIPPGFAYAPGKDRDFHLLSLRH
eukprot:4022492-Pleurochrysis_carterae.AAC.3